MPQWGLLALFQASAAPLVLLDLGVGFATVKYVAEALGRGSMDEAARTVHTTLLFNVAMGCAGALTLALLAPTLATHVFAIPSEQHSAAIHGFRIAGINWLLLSASATFTGVLSAHQLYDRVSKLAAVAALLGAAAGVATVLAGGGVVAVLIAQTLANAVMACAWFVAAARVLPGVSRTPSLDLRLLRRSLAFGAWQTVTVLGGLLAQWGDRYVLGSALGPALVGVYTITLAVEGRLYAAFHDMGEVLFPAVSHRQGGGMLANARRTALNVGWALSTAFGIAASTLATVGPDFLDLWISPETALTGGLPLRLLCVAGLLGMAITGPVFFMLGTGRTRWVAVASGITGIVALPVSLALVSSHGVSGVAVGAIAGMLSQWVLLVLAWREGFAEDVPFGDFALHIYSPALLSAVGMAALVALHGRVEHAPGWALLVLESALALAAAAALQLGLNELLPGGPARRRLLVEVLRPALARLGLRA
jgi:O-antigen/teichoic acid export membrane protein